MPEILADTHFNFFLLMTMKDKLILYEGALSTYAVDSRPHSHELP